MKKTIIVLTLIAISLSVFAVGSAAKQTNVYQCPKATSVPSVDGKINEKDWETALTIDFNIESLTANNGWALNSSSHGSAMGQVKVLWSDDAKKGGLYFAWHIEDRTQSFALDKNTGVPNSMDCVQIVIDPLYQRRVKVKNTAMAFTFVPYLSRSGNGFSVFPEEGATWYEHFYWVGRNQSLGVKVASVLDAKTDRKTDRNYLISGYDMEAFLPWKALTVLAGKPTAKVGTKIGIGFILIDYDFDYDHYELDHIQDYQMLLNVLADFSNGSRTTTENICAYPKNYNTLVLAESTATAEKTSAETEDSEIADVVVSGTETLDQIMEKDALLNPEDYTTESWVDYSEAYTAAKKYVAGKVKDEETENQIKSSLIAAINKLVLRYDNANASEEKDTTAAETKLNQLVNSTVQLKNIYSEEELADVNKYIESAKTVMENALSTEEELNEAYKLLNDAITALPQKDADSENTAGNTITTGTIILILFTAITAASLIFFILFTYIRKKHKVNSDDDKS